MPNNTAKSTDTITAGMVCGTRPEAQAKASGVYKVQCVGADGKVKWEEDIHNLVVNVGLQDMVNAYLDAGTQTTTWYLGLITGPGASVAAGNTMSSKGWTEFTSYSGNRKTAVFSTPTTADPSETTNSASPASFTMTGSGKVGGAFLTSSPTVGGTTGLLFSASAFQTPGDRDVVASDVLNVTYTFRLDGTP